MKPVARVMMTLCLGLTLPCVPTHAAVIQQVYTGTVTSGTDTAGLFGAAGADLSRAAFTATFQFDTSRGNTTSGTGGGVAFIALAGGASPSDPFLGAPTPLLSATLRIGGSSAYTFMGGNEDRTAIRSSANPVSVPSEYSSQAVDLMGSVLSVFIRSWASTFPTSLTTVGTYNSTDGAVTGDQFRIVGSDFTDQARGSLATQQLVVSVVTPNVNVPTPGLLPLFASGLAGFGILAVRRRVRRSPA